LIRLIGGSKDDCWSFEYAGPLLEVGRSTAPAHNPSAFRRASIKSAASPWVLGKGPAATAAKVECPARLAVNSAKPFTHSSVRESSGSSAGSTVTPATTDATGWATFGRFSFAGI